MSSESEILDMLAEITADIDQAQARLNTTRLAFPNADPWFIRTLDAAQVKIDSQREEVEILKMKCKYF